MLFVWNMCNFMCLDLSNLCCFSQVPPVLEPARPLLGRNEGIGTSKQEEKGGEACVLEHFVHFQGVGKSCRNGVNFAVSFGRGS